MSKTNMENKENNKEETKEEHDKDKPKVHKVGLVSQMTELNKKLDELSDKDSKEVKKIKQKMVSLPFGVKSQLKKLAIKNKLLIFYLTNNGAIKTVVGDVTDNWVTVDGIPRKMNIGYRFLYQGKYPAIIQPEWTLEPIGTKEYVHSVTEGSKESAAITIIRMMERKDELTKGKLGGKGLIWMIIGGIALAYILFGQG